MSLSIRQALAQSSRPSGDSARRDVEVLLCHCLSKPRSYLRAWPERELSAAQQQHFTPV